MVERESCASVRLCVWASVRLCVCAGARAGACACECACAGAGVGAGAGACAGGLRARARSGVRACVRAFVRGWVGGWVGGWVCVCGMTNPQKDLTTDNVSKCLAGLQVRKFRFHRALGLKWVRGTAHFAVQGGSAPLCSECCCDNQVKPSEPWTLSPLTDSDRCPRFRLVQVLILCGLEGVFRRLSLQLSLRALQHASGFLRIPVASGFILPPAPKSPSQGFEKSVWGP